MKKIITIIGLAAVTLAGVNAQTVITQWDFNAATSKLSASTGTGTASGLVVGSTFASDTTNSGSTDPNPVGTTNGGGAWNLDSSWPAQSVGNGTAGALFEANTTGFASPTYTGLNITFDLRTSNTASAWYRVDYTVDGGTNWLLGAATQMNNPLPSGSFGDRWHNSQSFSISNLSALDNADFGFRVVSVFNPNAFTQVNGNIEYDANTAYEPARNPLNGTNSNYGGGTWRFDMVTVTAVPEPTSALLLGLGALALGFRRRR